MAFDALDPTATSAKKALSIPGPSMLKTTTLSTGGKKFTKGSLIGLKKKESLKKGMLKA